MALDVDKLLADVSPDEPCGESLEYDAAYLELMRSAEGKAAQQMGDAVNEGEEPNWREVKAGAIELFGRTKDLGVAMVLLNAAICQDGIEGLRDGLKLVNELLDRHWDGLHPRLDPDDDNDPLERVNLIAALAAPPNQPGDPRKFQQRLRQAPLATSRRLGTFGLRDILLATGEIQPAEGQNAPDPGLIDGAFADTDLEELTARGAAAGEALALSKKLSDWLTSKVGATRACDLDPWIKAVKAVADVLNQQLAKRGVGEENEAADGYSSDGGGGGGGGGGGPSLSGTIRSREDVLRALDKIIDYYARAEPSSPVPLLVRRAQRLVTMNFIEAISDLSPAAMDQLKVIGGVDAMEAEKQRSVPKGPVAPSVDDAAPPAPAPKPVQNEDFGEPVKLQF